MAIRNLKDSLATRQNSDIIKVVKLCLYGWSPERSIGFGHDTLAAVLAVADDLR
ncbi:hypothetical protein [Photobacterium kishitanii]|uniref:hypothetical protein n=1 Tax=Photobacterium kishitanii TaxID=318456 RepID=UPI0015E6B7E2|nr:hypothetical protein [Photobacterium kishitanii]